MISESDSRLAKIRAGAVEVFDLIVALGCVVVIETCEPVAHVLIRMVDRAERTLGARIEKHTGGSR